ncbi:MAG: 2-hydroxyacyl-CoA dehydratase family protein [Thermoleophilia bacterium]|nr:2-hydroxyacyl-CoA dehydratase family protein [Thermoleophilia bacterium]
MPGLDNITGDSLSASLVRAAFLAQTRVRALQHRTARRYMDYHALSTSLELFKPGAIVPWVSYLFPTELLTAYGLTPLIPEVAAATLTGSDLREAVDNALTQLPLARDVCSYHRTALAALESDLLPAPSFCLGTTPLCLGKECLLEMLAVRYNVPFREIKVPLPPDEGETAPELVNEVAEQLRELHEEIGRLTGRKSQLRKAMVLSNRASAAWGKIMADRLAGRLELDGRRTFVIVFLGQLLWGTEEGAKDFERLLTERGRRDVLVPPAPPGKKIKKLLWLHTVPHHEQGLFELIRERGAAVIFEEMGQMHMDTIDPDDPFPGLARRLTDNVFWGSSARRARLNVALAKQLKADGVVHFNHWGCRHGLGSVPVLQAAFREAGIPFLAIDGDALARGGPEHERSRQALESFLELL